MSKADSYYLFVDETGVPDPKFEASPLYILCGCSILSTQRDMLKLRVEELKFKYWKHINIIFHSRDIQRNDKDFSIFRNNPELKKEFTKDLIKLLTSSPIKLTAIIIDKNLAKKKGWIQKDKFITESSYNLLKNFIFMLCAKRTVKGRVIIESSSDKDPFYLKAFNHYQSQGIPLFNLSSTDVKNVLTSITFVTKHNNDIETQITDLLAYGVKCKYLQKFGKNTFAKGTYEDRLITIVDKKLFSIDPNTSNKKRNLLNEVEPFLVLPR